MNKKQYYRYDGIFSTTFFFKDVMKSNSKTIALILLILIFAFPIHIAVNFCQFRAYNNENLDVHIESDLKGAKFWDLTGAPIFIDDSNPNYNWSKTEIENDWCNGNGSLSNPYTIENVTIDATNSPTGCGIYINNSKTEHFIIRNVKVYSVRGPIRGIKLENTNNGTLMNNNCSNNSIGIFLRYCDNNTLSGNTVSDNNYGISLFFCNSNKISGNIANGNYYSGIYLLYSETNAISGNVVNYNKEDGILLVDSNNNTLSGNTANYNRDNGIDLGYSHSNTVLNNNMSECGLRLRGSHMVSSHHIDDTNLVNGKPLYYYKNQINLNSNNFINAGQVILVNCNDSSILNLNTNYCTLGIILYYCNNNTISGNSASNNSYCGIYLIYSDLNTVSGNTANNNDFGIFLAYSNKNLISRNTANNNSNQGIILSSSNKNIILRNNANNNRWCGIYLFYSDTNTVSRNTANYNHYGIRLWFSNSNPVSENVLTGNVECISQYMCNENTFFLNGDCIYGIIPGFVIIFFLLGVLSVAVILISKRIKRSSVQNF